MNDKNNCKPSDDFTISEAMQLYKIKRQTKKWERYRDKLKSEIAQDLALFRKDLKTIRTDLKEMILNTEMELQDFVDEFFTQIDQLKVKKQAKQAVDNVVGISSPYAQQIALKATQQTAEITQSEELQEELEDLEEAESLKVGAFDCEFAFPGETQKAISETAEALGNKKIQVRKLQKPNRKTT